MQSKQSVAIRVRKGDGCIFAELRGEGPSVCFEGNRGSLTKKKEQW